MCEKIPLEKAKKIIEISSRLDIISGNFDDIYLQLDDLESKRVKSKLKELIGELFLVSFDFVGIVVKEYPDLDPDKSE